MFRCRIRLNKCVNYCAFLGYNTRWAAKRASKSMNQPPTEFESATPFQRIVAQCIDTFLILVLVAIPASFASPHSTLETLIGLCSVVIGLAYRLLGDGLFGGAALGKRLLGIYVVDAATRKPCSIGQAALRMGILVIPF